MPLREVPTVPVLGWRDGQHTLSLRSISRLQPQLISLREISSQKKEMGQLSVPVIILPLSSLES